MGADVALAIGLFRKVQNAFGMVVDHVPSQLVVEARP
jgi:hypothetical protein